jgi:HrpA-like RNA helicase
VSHLIIDEVHERDVHTDFLLAAVKSMLPQRPHLKLLLMFDTVNALYLRFCNTFCMSATIDADRFARYFGENVPVVRVPGLAYHVTDFFLEDVIKQCGYRVAPKPIKCSHPPFSEWRGDVKEGEPTGDEDAWRQWLRDLVQSHGEGVASAVQHASCSAARDLDLDLLLRVIECICDTGADGAILVFVPGWADITALHDNLRASGCVRRNPCKIIPLHSQLPMGDQTAVFVRPPQGVRKIVIATSIAGNTCFSRSLKTSILPCVTETSITIDDVVHVVDSGRCKSRFSPPASAIISFNCAFPSLSSLPAVDLLRVTLL